MRIAGQGDSQIRRATRIVPILDPRDALRLALGRWTGNTTVDSIDVPDGETPWFPDATGNVDECVRVGKRACDGPSIDDESDGLGGTTEQVPKERGREVRGGKLDEPESEARLGVLVPDEDDALDRVPAVGNRMGWQGETGNLGADTVPDFFLSRIRGEAAHQENAVSIARRCCGDVSKIYGEAE